MDPETEGSTPTSQWAPPQSWWVGDDARSADGNNANDQQQPSSNRNGRRGSRLMFTAETESTGEGVPHRDPRSLFGDLPNSSFNPDLLGDPIQRELELRAAAGSLQRSPAAATAAAAAGPLTVTFADPSRPYGDNLRGNGTDVHGFWRDECGRLQGQVASLDRERERWEHERRQLQAHEVDRARDLAGLKRAVEAQSQLVMESLVAAQRLAASGAASAPTRERPTALYDDILQTAWVQPSVPPETVRDLPRGDGGGRTRPPWSPPVSPRAGVVTNLGWRDFSAATVEDSILDRRRTGSTGAADALCIPQRSYASVTSAEAAPSQYSANLAAFSRTTQPRHGGTTVVAAHAPASRRNFYEPATISNSNGILNTSNNHASRSSAAVRSTSMEMALSPRASFGNTHRHTLPADAGESKQSSRVPHNQRRTVGWRRISSGRKIEGGGSTADDDTGEGGSEVWEWNGRRVVIHVSHPEQRPSAEMLEGDAKTGGGGEDGTSNGSRAGDDAETPVAAASATTTAEAEAVSASIVPHSLLNDIQDIKAMVQALAAGAAGAQASVPQTGLQQMAAAPTVCCAPEARTITNETAPTPLHLQPKPPDIARSQTLGTSSPHTNSPTRRRVSLPTFPQTPPVPASATGDTRSDDLDAAPISDRPGASEHINSEPHRERQAVEQELGVQESTQGRGGDSVSADGPKALPVAPREDNDGETEGQITSSSSRDGSGGGGPVDGEGRDGHASSLVDQTAAVEDDDRGTESTEFNQPVANEGNTARAVAEASRSPRLEDNIAGVKGEVRDGSLGLLDEAPEEKCHVG